jgi:uroporphyrinogen decarboxylase
MNDRERFAATMHYQPRDRAPIMDFGFWDETLVLWHDQGLPVEVDKTNRDQFFGMDVGIDSPAARTGVGVKLMPTFEERVIEDRGEHEVYQKKDGVLVLRHKFMSSIPKPLKYRLEDRDSWQKHYKPRLDPDHGGRYPEDWEQHVKLWTDPAREFPLFLEGGSFYGWIHNWMGLENLSYVVYDDPAWFEEMVATAADCVITVLGRVLETGARFDGCGMWEDMCYNSGSLLSPKHFKLYLVPHYRRLADLLHKHGVDVIWLDCDGNIDLLLPLWLDAGINCTFPVEVGTWSADPISYRREYGCDLLILGGFDKRILARSKRDIEDEVHGLAPLVEEGGHIGFCDHRVPPNVPLENYRHYLETVRRVWGPNVNLKPMGRLDFSKEKQPTWEALC